jgi:superfamily I DNA/RNA helicase
VSAPGTTSIIGFDSAWTDNPRAPGAICTIWRAPSPGRIETVTDAAELEEVYETGRHLFYVACTRARDRLLITGVHPVSEFLDDLG